jgi:hypothetical protein
MAVMILGVAEIMAYVKTCQLVKYSIGFTPLYITESYEDHLAEHDLRLGWTTLPDHVDALG